MSAQPHPDATWAVFVVGDPSVEEYGAHQRAIASLGAGFQYATTTRRGLWIEGWPTVPDYLRIPAVGTQEVATP